MRKNGEFIMDTMSFLESEEKYITRITTNIYDWCMMQKEPTDIREHNTNLVFETSNRIRDILNKEEKLSPINVYDYNTGQFYGVANPITRIIPGEKLIFVRPTFITD